MTTRVGDWIDALDELYHPSWAEGWDAVGLVTGSPDDPAERALFAVDPTFEVVEEAVSVGARLVVTHHPLLLRGVHGVAETTYKGRLVAQAIRAGIALHCAHTNADVADPGVSDTLAARLGLRDVTPLQPAAAGEAVKIVTFVPADALDAVVDAMAAAGAGVIGDYSRCFWTTAGEGGFDAGVATNPAVGRAGARERVPEQRVEMIVPTARVDGVVAALRTAHPYEEPAFDLLRALVPNRRGLGRIGRLPQPQPLDAFAALVSTVLPLGPAGIRVAGDTTATVEQVAVCGGAGDSLIDAAIRAGVDVFVTADLRHHATREAVERGLALIDAGHWTTERPWLDDAAVRVTRALTSSGRTVDAIVSDIVTDPWACTRPGGPT